VGWVALLGMPEEGLAVVEGSALAEVSPPVALLSAAAASPALASAPVDPS